MSGCAQSECTVTETGTCLLNNNPSTCPNLVLATEAEARPALVEKGKAEFPSSRAYTLHAARGLMAERYVRVVGILGEPDAGKTACLASLYLSIGKQKLEDFRFADSRTLMGFEEISQGARQWNQGQMPDQLTDHTELTDDRTPGFLHIKLVRTDQSQTVDLLCSDLPGEWTTDLIDQNRFDRMEFLQRADVIWLVINGSDVATPDKRQLCVFRIKTLIQRLSVFLGGQGRLILVITRRDLQAADPTMVEELRKEAETKGFDVEAVEVASFSDVATIEPGHGISTLIKHSSKFECNIGLTWERVVDKVVFEPPIIGLVRRSGA